MVTFPDPSEWFVPCASGGEMSRARINARLRESFDHVLDQCAPHVPVDRSSARALLASIDGSRRIAPAVFGALFDILREIDEGELDDVAAAIRRLFLLDPFDARPLAIRPFDGNSFNGREEDIFLAEFESESLLREQIGRLDPAAAQDARTRIRAALSILEKYAPQSFAETQAVVSEIVPAAGRVVKDLAFDGCSSLERWGAILLNMNIAKTDLELAETLVHEGAHVALFGKAPVDFHVENDDGERFASPLRYDPRPMSGIYHATFVLARMTYAMHEIMESPTAPQALRDAATGRARADARLFFDGYAVVEAHARYTPEGAAIMRDTHAYMSSLRPEA
jgi:hypothetical protein